MQIDNTQNIIDSRDIIDRINELTDELQAEHEEQETTLSFEYWLQDENNSQNPDDVKELRILQKLADECEGHEDWEHGETLISRDYFVGYIEELINDCYEMPKEINSSQWPYRHITIDYQAAADEAEQDYMSVDFDGNEYLMRA